MPQHDYLIDNASGSTVRADINSALAAIVSSNSGTTAPSTTYAYQMWVDTSGGSPLLKIRNGANSAWITLGDVSLSEFGFRAPVASSSAPSAPIAYQLWIDTSGAVGGIYGTDKVLKIRNSANSAWVIIGSVTVDNFGMLPLAGGTVTGAVTFSSTGYITIPVGTTLQRPSAVTGQIRFNSDLVSFEGYNGTTWSPIGGGGYVVTAVQSVTAGGTVTISTTDTRQLRHVQGNAASVSAHATQPFGSSAPKDGTEITLIGNADDNSVILSYADSAKGLVGNFTSIELTKFKVVTFIYSTSLDRYILAQGAV